MDKRHCPISASRPWPADILNILLFLAGLTGRNPEIKDTPALRASQSHSVVQHIHFPDRHGARMFDDATVEHDGSLIARRPDGIIRRIHDDRDSGDDVADCNVVGHPAGTAREDQFVLILKPFQRDTERMHGETLLYEGPAVKHLRHDTRSTASLGWFALHGRQDNSRSRRADRLRI